MHPGIPFYPETPTRGGVEQAILELNNAIDKLRDELVYYTRPINPSWYEQFNYGTQKAGPGYEGSGRETHVQSIKEDIARLERQLDRVKRAMPHKP